MKVYRNHYRDPEDGECRGFSYHSSKAKARAAHRAECPPNSGWDYKRDEVALPLQVEVSRAGIVNFLNVYAQHADNG